MTERRYLGLIPARGGSKRIPGKNIKVLAGKPLIAHTIEAAIQSKSLWKVVVSTEDSEIARIAKDAGAEVPFVRPPRLAKDNTPTLGVVMHALKHYSDKGTPPTDVMILQPTSPLRTSQDIIDSITLHQKSGADSLISVREQPVKLSTLVYPKSGGSKLWLSRPKPRMKSEVFQINGAIYIASVDTILKSKSFYGHKIIGYGMPTERSVDIDTDYDWQMAEMLIRGAL